MDKLHPAVIVYANINNKRPSTICCVIMSYDVYNSIISIDDANIGHGVGGYRLHSFRVPRTQIIIFTQYPIGAFNTNI